MKTYCLALDLKDDPALVAEYKRWHQPDAIWPEVIERIRGGGVISQEIFLLGTRMVMVLHTTDEFNLSAKFAALHADPIMQEWEDLMWKYQKPAPHAMPGEKWVLMENIFKV